MDQEKAYVKNNLSFDQRFKIREWIKKNASEIRDRRPTYAALASELSDKLGFVVVAAHVKTMARHAGVSWLPRRSAAAKTVKASAADRTLALAVADLYGKLGVALPAELAAMVEAAVQGADVCRSAKEAAGPVPAKFTASVGRICCNGSIETVTCP